MIPRANPKVFFDVSVLKQDEGYTLNAIRPDKDGYYTVVVGELEEKSRNECYYNSEAILKQVTEKDSIFNLALTEGSLTGEWQHPPITSDIARIETIDATLESHHIRRVYTKEDNGRVFIIAEIKPYGPYGKYLEDSLQNPHQNTSFSLRSLMKSTWDKVKQCEVRYIVRLVTFDHVNTPGYKRASKRYAPATESIYSKEITLEDFINPNNGFALESFSDKEIMDLFEVSEKEYHQTKAGLYVKNTSTYFDKNGSKKSIIHSALYN